MTLLVLVAVLAISYFPLIFDLFQLSPLSLTAPNYLSTSVDLQETAKLYAFT
jgi:hypothetical protein